MADPRNPPSASIHATEQSVPLSTLRDGERGVADLAAMACDDCDLLNAMGMTDQCEVRVCRRGEPCIVQVHTTRLGLSAALASRIMVMRASAASKPTSSAE